jgi:hypothetical protein
MNFTPKPTPLRRQLEIHRFSFTVPFSPQLPETVDQTAARKNRGGKPLAAHWDELWATIAVSIYSGDLQPKTQADIERWMSSWLVDRDLDASVSSVRQRARTLWRKLDSAE